MVGLHMSHFCLTWQYGPHRLIINYNDRKQYSQLSVPGIQQTSDWKYSGKKIPVSSKKQTLSLLIADNYLHNRLYEVL